MKRKAKGTRVSKGNIHSGMMLFAATLIIGLVMAACAATPTGTPTTVPPEIPAIDEASLEPGLAVLYYEKWYKDVDEMTDDPAALEMWRPGKPVLYIDNQFGSGEVFTSGLTRKVGVRMTGFLRFPESGLWAFRAYSNDGIRVIVNGQIVVNDPLLHLGGDRYSSVKTYRVEKAGWHPLLVKYYQKKGTAALSLQWKGPTATDFTPIPAEAYAHIPE